MRLDQFLQCRAPTCALRFPGPPDMACPFCGALTEQVAARYTNVPLRQAPSHQLAALFDNVRSAHNVGAMLRTAESVGVVHCYHVGITPPADNAKVAKAALGSEMRVATSYHRDGVTLARRLLAHGSVLWALESTEDATPALAARIVPDAAAPNQPVVLVVGSEISGVDPGILALCQRVLALPMVGDKNSLNVGHAFAAAIYALSYGGRA